MYRGLAILVLLMSGFTRAQDRPSKRLFIASMIAFNAANVLDVTSSYGKRELNPALAGANQTFAMRGVGVKVGVVGSVDLFEVLFLRRHRELMRTTAVGNFIMSATLGGLAIHNYGVSSPP